MFNLKCLAKVKNCANIGVPFPALPDASILFHLKSSAPLVILTVNNEFTFFRSWSLIPKTVNYNSASIFHACSLFHPNFHSARRPPTETPHNCNPNAPSYTSWFSWISPGRPSLSCERHIERERDSEIVGSCFWCYMETSGREIWQHENWTECELRKKRRFQNSALRDVRPLG